MASCSIYDYDATGLWSQYVNHVYCNWISHRNGLRPVLEDQEYWTFCMSEERKIHLDKVKTGVFQCSVGLMHEHCQSVFWDTLYDLHLKKDKVRAEQSGETYEQNIMHHWRACKPEEYTTSATTAVIDGKERASVIVVASTSALPQKYPTPSGTEYVETIDLTSTTSEAEEAREITSLTEGIEDISSASSAAEEESEQRISETENALIEEILQASPGPGDFGDIDFETPMPVGEEDELQRLERYLESEENYSPTIPSKRRFED